ncbi:MAG: phytanoyl-CoA dioxygenase family protein [Planctomycetes bacterium]|nr:phytanoyl-CoA dioxygenase family protein [Planctomycetota bacterium]
MSAGGAAWSVASFERDGFAIVPDVLSRERRDELCELFGAGVPGAGARVALAHPAIGAAVRSRPVRDLVADVLGAGAFAVKATLFDKHDGANWLVPWHQDLMIPLRERREVEGFSVWSEKGGVVHARPPADVLEAMVAVRLDLDGSAASSGPLRVLPGTHRREVLDADAIDGAKRNAAPSVCVVPERGALVMRPLLLHASSRATTVGHRRIVHLEFANRGLPGGLQWHARAPIGSAAGPVRDVDER